MIIMGIDQGLAISGFSILEITELNNKKVKKNDIVVNNYKIKVKKYGTIETSSKEDITKRLVRFFDTLSTIVVDYKPDIIVCERLFYSHPAKGTKNRSVSIMSTEMINAMIAYCCGIKDIDFTMYTPTQVKKTLCDNGKAQKEEVINHIDNLFDIDVVKTKRDHVCDSVAIALTHVYKI